MFTAINRLQTTFGYFTSVFMVVCAAVSIASMVQLYSDGAYNMNFTVASFTPKVTEKFTRRFGSADGKAKDNCRVVFDLDADLTPLFNWNTKQVFAYLTAEYPGKRADINNRVVFWDKIIKTKKDAYLQLKNARGAYSVYDVDKKFSGQNATLRLEWNVQPHVGWLVFGETPVQGESSFVFPQVVKKN